MLVDDDADDQLFFKDALKEIRPDIVFEIANNGKEALQSLQQTPYPEVIFLDLNMPVMNGFDALAAIRKDEHLKEIPIIIFTTTSEQNAIRRTYELGANGFFQKPNDFSTILNKLKSILETDFVTNEKSPSFSMTSFSI